MRLRYIDRESFEPMLHEVVITDVSPLMQASDDPYSAFITLPQECFTKDDLIWLNTNCPDTALRYINFVDPPMALLSFKEVGDAILFKIARS